MKKIKYSSGLLCLLLLFAAGRSVAQAKVVLNDNAFVVLGNGARLVIDNPATNALQTSGAGGNIVSEGETNLVQWNIGTNTGTYVVPFTTVPAAQGGDEVKIPLQVNITGAGTGSGGINFATYKTDNLNEPYASDVTNMYSTLIGGDGSLYAIDRFWIIDAGSYSTKPTVSMSFGYDDGTDESGGSNVFSEPSLRAQRFNTTYGGWEGLLYGSDNSGANTVSAVNTAGSDFYRTWTLVSLSAPLPVSLTTFTGECDGQTLHFRWTTASELENKEFTLQKSNDGDTWSTVVVIPGAGTSTVMRNYDYATSSDGGTAYYRLQQTDESGRSTYSTVISAGCGAAGSVSILNANGQGLLRFNQAPGVYQVQLIDLGGRVVRNQQIEVKDAMATYVLQSNGLPANLYLVNCSSPVRSVSGKVLLGQ